MLSRKASEIVSRSLVRRYCQHNNTPVGTPTDRYKNTISFLQMYALFGVTSGTIIGTYSGYVAARRVHRQYNNATLSILEGIFCGITLGGINLFLWPIAVPWFIHDYIHDKNGQ